MNHMIFYRLYNIIKVSVRIFKTLRYQKKETKKFNEYYINIIVKSGYLRAKLQEVIQSYLLICVNEKKVTCKVPQRPYAENIAWPLSGTIQLTPLSPIVKELVSGLALIYTITYTTPIK
ncbi:hypothetical protein RIR_jg16870.t1 [Rhizophagus irregularis DAOM 181602=DAOM 197198]|nr:hypothetical protein RIR_jg16870.t1 [Rhizophagus irregularis DAOM 181602=DAOM 197198]